MSESQSTTITVTILDKEYQVACPEEEVEALRTSARYLHEQMAAIRGSGKVLGADRIAVMAALNIANELLNQQQTAGTSNAALNVGIGKLTRDVDAVLAEQKQLSL
ncbi:MAG: cell division protein ZapA [Pseudomonadota bacterium]